MTQQRFNSLVYKKRSKINRLVAQLTNGVIDDEEFGERFYEELYDGHSSAYAFGRQLAGDRARRNEDDELIALDLVDGVESDYLNNFLDDIKEGRYTDDAGKLKPGAIRQRANLYVSKLRGTANEAFVNASDDDDEFEWRMTSNEPCDDCPRFAALSPFRKEELYTYPGAGDTECLTNCLCILVRVSDGKEGFSPTAAENDQ